MDVIMASNRRNTSCLSYTKGIPLRTRDRASEAPADGVVLALTFGTLLSSQGADAHRVETFRPFSGQPL